MRHQKLVELLDLIDKDMFAPVSYFDSDDSVGSYNCCGIQAYGDHQEDCYFSKIKNLSKTLRKEYSLDVKKVPDGK